MKAISRLIRRGEWGLRMELEQAQAEIAKLTGRLSALEESRDHAREELADAIKMIEHEQEHSRHLVTRSSQRLQQATREAFEAGRNALKQGNDWTFDPRAAAVDKEYPSVDELADVNAHAFAAYQQQSSSRPEETTP